MPFEKLDVGRGKYDRTSKKKPKPLKPAPVDLIDPLRFELPRADSVEVVVVGQEIAVKINGILRLHVKRMDRYKIDETIPVAEDTPRVRVQRSRAPIGDRRYRENRRKKK